MRDAPCFQEAELRGENRPPFRREPSAASAAVAGACPYAQPPAVDGNGNIALPRVAVHRGFRTGFKGEFQPVQVDCVHFQKSEAIFERTLTEPDELCAESIGHIKGGRSIHIAERRVIVGESAGRLNIGRGAVSADGHLQGERGRALFVLRGKGDGECIQSAAAQFDDAAHAGLSLRFNDAGFFQNLDAQRCGGHGNIQRLSQFAYAQCVNAQFLHDADAHGGSQRMSHAIKRVRLADGQVGVFSKQFIHTCFPPTDRIIGGIRRRAHDSLFGWALFIYRFFELFLSFSPWYNEINLFIPAATIREEKTT